MSLESIALNAKIREEVATVVKAIASLRESAAGLVVADEAPRGPFTWSIRELESLMSASANLLPSTEVIIGIQALAQDVNNWISRLNLLKTATDNATLPSEVSILALMALSIRADQLTHFVEFAGPLVGEEKLREAREAESRE